MARVSVGTTVIVTGTVSIINDAGGTSSLPKAQYRAKVIRRWEDDETGVRYEGVLLDPAAVDLASRIGTTEYPNPEKTFTPNRVFFSEFDCVREQTSRVTAQDRKDKGFWPWIYRDTKEFKERVTVSKLCADSCFAQKLADGVCELRGRWVCSFCGAPVKVSPAKKEGK